MTKKGEAPVGQTGASESNSSGLQAVCAAAYHSVQGAASETACHVTESSQIKMMLVTAMSAVWHLWPALGVALGRFVLAMWPGFREA